MTNQNDDAAAGRKLPILALWWYLIDVMCNEKFLKYYNILAIYNSDDILENVRERIFVRSIVYVY